MTEKQKQQFNNMRTVLIRISKGYMTTNQLRKSPEAKFIGYEEVLEMSYENIQNDAKNIIKGVKAIT